MASISYDGKRFPLVDRPTFGELEWVEKQAKTGFEAMSGMTKNRGYMLLSLRRAGVLLSWAETADLSPADIVADDDETDEGPERAGEDPTQLSGDGGPPPAI